MVSNFKNEFQLFYLPNQSFSGFNMLPTKRQLRTDRRCTNRKHYLKVIPKAVGIF